MVLTEDVSKEVKKILERMEDSIEIVYHEEPTAQYNEHTKQLLVELSELTDKIKLSFEDNHAEFKPSFELKGKNKGTIRFMGIPSGQEFATLLEGIIMTSTGQHHLTEETVTFLQNLENPLNLKVFVTPTCPHCPASVFLAHNMAMVSDKVDASMVEAMEFPELSQKFNISGVPNTIVNDKEGFVGSHPETSAINEIKRIIGVGVA